MLTFHSDLFRRRKDGPLFLCDRFEFGVLDLIGVLLPHFQVRNCHAAYYAVAPSCGVSCLPLCADGKSEGDSLSPVFAKDISS